jgi:CRISPR-associated endoribonuclease Cas6
LRIKLTFFGIGIFIPFNPNQFVHAAILDKIGRNDPDYAKELHDSTSFKFFTFSEFNIPKRKVNREGIKSESDSISIYVSSPSERFIQAFLGGIVTEPELRIGKTILKLESSQIVEDPDFGSGKGIFKTLAPITASVKEENLGKSRIIDLLPDDHRFYENLKKNIVRKYNEFGGEITNADFEVKLIKPLKTRRIKIKDDFHIGNRMIFEVFGNPELIRFAYNCGFGEKNSMGFGMVEAKK